MIVVNSRYLSQPLTGVQRYAIEISKKLKKIDPEIRFFAPKNILYDDLVDQLEVEVVGNFISHFWEQISLPIYLKKYGNPLLINLCNTAPLMYANKIVTVHDIAFNKFPENYSWLFQNYYNFLIPRILKTSKKILTVSKFSKNELINTFKIKSNKINVIYNAVSESFFTNNKIIKENYILSVASLSKQKNFETLIDAYNNLSIQGVKLFIVGENNRNLQNSISQKINSNPNIIFTGRVDDFKLQELYANAICFIFPSFYEGFGIPPLEAMASGTPVIASNISAIPEVCGEAALYFNPFSVEDLMQKILNLIKEKKLRKSYVEKGFKQVAKFSWAGSAQNLVKIINQINN